MQDEEIQKLSQEIEEIYSSRVPVLEPGEGENFPKAMSPMVSKNLGGPYAGNLFVAAEMVTPHDLQDSPNLVKIGRLEKN